MPTKKQSANWFIAATHSTLALSIPLFLSFLIGILFTTFNVSDSIQLYVIILTYFIFTYLGVIYSAQYVNKTYVISDAGKIVNLSTAYIFVFDVIFFGLGSSSALSDWYLYLSANGGLLGMTIVVSKTVIAAIIILIFYFASKKYIRVG